MRRLAAVVGDNVLLQEHTVTYTHTPARTPKSRRTTPRPDTAAAARLFFFSYLMATDGRSSAGLVDLPQEVVWRIVVALLDGSAAGIDDAASLAATCAAMASVLMDDDAMWRVLVRRHFSARLADLHTAPTEFGVRWMRIYARLSRTASHAVALGPTHQEPTYRAVCEGILASDDLACGRFAMGRLSGYGSVCTAQHDQSLAERVHCPSARPTRLAVVFMEGHFTDDLLDGRGILRRGEWPPCDSEGIAPAPPNPTVRSTTCRCMACRTHNAPLRRRDIGCEHECSRGGCHWCHWCRFDGCTCDTRGEPCSTCTERLRACAARRFISRLETFDGCWARGVPHGHAIALFECGTTYEGPWWRGLPHGRGLVNGARHRQWFHGVLLPRGRLVYGHVARAAVTTATTETMVVAYQGDIKPRSLTVGMALATDTPLVLDRDDGEDHDGGDGSTISPLVDYPYKAYARHGHGRMRYADGAVFEGEWIEDARHRGALTRADGVVLDGAWHGGGGSGTVCWPDGRRDPQGAWDASGRLCPRPN
ncbi:Morn repeat incomplete domain containing protein [Pandoravirus dulcis]|uniref:Morn repeat incomplete domain containing protein n=1 Tax=Pandoravirus dulcis TaxID=1349409 RepID=S4VVN9_9VIRU|nr:Morn repeat incomplete domain containing protein [Pandoravirus dulcis]AGO82166.2 Morn repeat incomplete domain containing protein [Pandoravirus dulcis]